VQFHRSLRAAGRAGEVRISVRIWRQPRVKPGGRYAIEGGSIVVESAEEISLDGVTPAMASASGFAGVDDLMSLARHGRGDRLFLIRFHFEACAG
jgi:hypothetical protein